MDSSGPWGPTLLEGQIVRLVPLTLAHAVPLAYAARDPEVCRYLRTPLPRTPEGMSELIRHRLDMAAKGEVVPFATTLAQGGRVVGTTNFAEPVPADESVEIGGTWIDSEFWRTPVNTEAKLLMLRYAFERAKAYRVYLQTDVRNVRSRTAIARIGGIEEGTFRDDVHLGGGVYRSSVYFSILAPEWPKIQARLQSSLPASWSAPPTAAPPRRSSVGDASAVLQFEPPSANPTAFQGLPTISGRYVRLVPLDRQHAAALAFAGRDPEVWRYIRYGPAQDPTQMLQLIETFLADRAKGEVFPFAIVSLAEERPVGIFRYLEVDRANSAVELGTWLDSTLWRTPFNTEVKYLGLRHAFETEKVHRVILKTDARNTRSQAAIERLGGVREGALRCERLRPDGYRRTSIVYSILEREWPTVRARLEESLRRPWPPATSPSAA